MLGLTQAPLKKGSHSRAEVSSVERSGVGWGDLECLEHYTFRSCCVSPICFHIVEDLAVLSLYN